MKDFTMPMNLPDDFVSYTREMMGDSLFSRLAEGLQAPSVTSIRLNPEKGCSHSTSLELDSEVPWCRDGYYLSSRPQFTFDPLFHAGSYYVQEAASMFVDHVVRQHIHHPVLMLDLCAAPGGKSTALRAALPGGSLLVCNEPIRQRANILMENMQKWGHPDVAVTNATTSSYRKSGVLFDAILADVPCSGEGMFRKDAGAIAEWSAQNVIRCQHLQREIVADAWACLRPGGVLVYSTCTLNTKENEENIAWMKEALDAHPLEVAIDSDWGITGSLLPGFDIPVYRFIPGIARGEGLFMAIVRKDGERASALDAIPGKKDRKSRKSAASREPHELSRWLRDSEAYIMADEGDIVRAIPSRWHHIYDRLKSLRLLHAGVEVAARRGRDYVPCHALALSTSLRHGVFEEHPVSREEAVSYLRREVITPPADIKRGFVLITYEGHPLGLVKHLVTRANNLYPQEWRILSQPK